MLSGLFCTRAYSGVMLISGESADTQSSNDHDDLSTLCQARKQLYFEG